MLLTQNRTFPMRAAEAWQGMSWFNPCLLTAAFGSVAKAALRHTRKGNLPGYLGFRGLNESDIPMEGQFT